MATTTRVLTLNLTSTTASTLSLNPIPQIDSAHIADGAIMNIDISANANIALSKLADVSGTNLSLDEYLYDLSNNVSQISDLDASDSVRGYVNTAAQTFAGAKTFKDVVTINEHQHTTSYSPLVNTPLKPFLIIPNQDLSGVQYVGGGYYKYSIDQATSLTNNNAIAIVTRGIEGSTNTSFFAELIFIGTSTVTDLDNPMEYSSQSTTTKLILTCTGFSVVNTILGEPHPNNNFVVSTYAQDQNFVILINGAKFKRLFMDFYAADAIWQIHSLDINESLDASVLEDDFETYGFVTI